jgi:hypothetical protein
VAERDDISKRWFDVDSVDVHISGEFPEYIDPAKYFSNSDFVRLSGAFSGATIDVRPEFTKRGFNGAAVVDGIRLSVKHNAVMRMERILRLNETGGWLLHNAKIRIKPEMSGHRLGARIVTIQARAAQELGFEAIKLDAVGSYQQAQIKFEEDRWIGYYLWPRLGFDAPMPNHVLKSLPNEFLHCRQVSELLQSKEGIDWWLLYGDSLDSARFDLTADSVSWQLLLRYLSEHNIKV